MDNMAKLFINPSVLLYLLVVVGTQVLYSWWRRQRNTVLTTRRRTRGLPKEILLNHAQQLAERRRLALIESALLLTTVVFFPFVLIAATHVFGAWFGTPPENASSEKTGLTITFVTLLISSLFSSPNVLKAFLEGLAYKTLAAFSVPFQIGDRVTIKGTSGKVIQLDTFFVVIETLKRERVSIPTYQLWTESVTSINGGGRDSLCEMVFYLSPRVSAAQRQAAEDIIWDTIQASAYLEPSKPIQIYLSQTAETIQLTARAYVASTYNEPLFSSDVTRAFLNFAHEKKIPLGCVTG
ncbi:MAG: mechanosensitive ion channel domain-containing protein [Cyanobacteria bacterium J06598_3]